MKDLTSIGKIMTVKEEVKDIASGNEVIARWMGLESYQDSRYGKLWPDPLGTHHTEFSLQYNTDWRWLMPVWYKFRDLKFEGFHGHRISHENFVFRISAAILHKDSPEPTFNELVKGIEWFNSIKEEDLEHQLALVRNKNAYIETLERQINESSLLSTDSGASPNSEI
jgi:hypothetical protein